MTHPTTGGPHDRSAPVGNERLTALAGAVLFVLLAVEGVTLVDLRPLFAVHAFVGVMLAGPVGVKLASTGYRFIRYYTGNLAYRHKGPPEPVLRVIGPIVMLSTVAVFATGIVLLILGPGYRNPWVELHKLTFIVWVVFVSLHVLVHLPAVARAVGIGRGSREQLARASAGAAGRWIAISGALVAGLILAIVLIPDFAAWTAHGALVHHHHQG